VVDALNERAVDELVGTVVHPAGTVDISFNLIAVGDVQRPLQEISVDDFLQPIMTAMRSHFLTTRAAARHMVARGSGVILTFGGGGPQIVPGVGGFKDRPRCGPHGIRVVTIKTGGIPETLPQAFPGRDQIVAGLQHAALLPWTQPSMTLELSRPSWPQTRLGRSLRPMSTSPRAPSSTNRTSHR